MWILSGIWTGEQYSWKTDSDFFILCSCDASCDLASTRLSSMHLTLVPSGFSFLGFFSWQPFAFPSFNSKESEIRMDDWEIGNVDMVIVFMLLIKSLASCWRKIRLSFTWPDSMVCSKTYRPLWLVPFNIFSFRLYECGWNVFLISILIRCDNCINVYGILQVVESRSVWCNVCTHRSLSSLSLPLWLDILQGVTLWSVEHDNRMVITDSPRYHICSSADSLVCHLVRNANWFR